MARRRARARRQEGRRGARGMGRRAREGRACGRRRCAFRTQRRTRRPSCGTRRAAALPAGKETGSPLPTTGSPPPTTKATKCMWTASGVVINGEHFDSWQDAHARYGYGHLHEERWNEPCGYTVCGERFDTLEQARAKYGDGVGTTIPGAQALSARVREVVGQVPLSARRDPGLSAVGHLRRRVGHGAVPVLHHPAVLHGWGTPSAASALRRSCRARTPSAWWHGSASWRSS